MLKVFVFDVIEMYGVDYVTIIKKTEDDREQWSGSIHEWHKDQPYRNVRVMRYSWEEWEGNGYVTIYIED